MKRGIAAAFIVLAFASCTSTLPGPAANKAADHPEARAFTTTAQSNAMAEVDAALAKAAASGTHVLAVLGANWCHDSRALAGWLETPRFTALTDEHFEVVYVNVGMPQTGDTNNLAVANRFGIQTLEGTPSLLVLGADGALLNADTAKTWRNAASRSEDDIYTELASFAPAGE